MEPKENVNIEDVIEAQRNLFDTNYSYWLDHVLFSFNWWFLLILSIVPWIFWWKFVNKEKLLEISAIGFLSMVIISFLDLLGSSFVFWTYGYNVLQMLLPLATIDITLLPVINMFLYQSFPKWKSYLIATFCLALFGTFLAEPLFIWMGIYIVHEWKPIYSLPIYIAIAIGLKWIVEKLKKYQIYQ